jgi:pleiotropic regulator 1
MEIETTPALRLLIAANSRTGKKLFPDGPATKRQKTDSADGQKEPELGGEACYRQRGQYADVQELPPALAAKQSASGPSRRKAVKTPNGAAGPRHNVDLELLEDPTGARHESTSIIRRTGSEGNADATGGTKRPSRALDVVSSHAAKPEWHAPWKLMRVISGHLGWVRSLAVEPDNKWFASGAGDRTIKIWDLATGSLRLTLTGHISTVRGLAVSPRHPYLFSCGEDKMVKCWDLETNKVIRHYHGHLSGVYALSLHPSLDILVTGGRDGVARVWDMRTRANIHVLAGHTGTVTDIRCQEGDPQVISSSLDSTVRMWDLAAGKTMGVLTHHKKGVRALAIHPTEFTFATGSTASIKQWKCPEGAFMQNFEGHNAIINTLSVNAENVLFSGGRVCLFNQTTMWFLMVSYPPVLPVR